MDNQRRESSDVRVMAMREDRRVAAARSDDSRRIWYCCDPECVHEVNVHLVHLIDDILHEPNPPKSQSATTVQISAKLNQIMIFFTHFLMNIFNYYLDNFFTNSQYAYKVSIHKLFY